MHYESNGAFTGEISALMLKSINVYLTILGHSERRTYFNETDQILLKKIRKALEEDIEIIFKSDAVRSALFSLCKDYEQEKYNQLIQS